MMSRLAFGLIWVLSLTGTLLPHCARADDSDCDVREDPACRNRGMRTLDAIGAYVTAPIHWDTEDWLYFAGALTAIGVSHHFDSTVRDHFTAGSPSALNSSNSHDLQDSIPTIAMLVGTFGYANISDDNNGRRETNTMIESAALSLGAAYLFKYAAGRQGPDQTTDVNRWRAGGNSFPSLHTTGAFAIGTVLAESGNDDYRWARRLIGYGAASFTVYERLDHNAHWLSDTVAGAVLGAASARFAMNRSLSSRQKSTLEVTPLTRGAMIRYSIRLN